MGRIKAKGLNQSKSVESKQGVESRVESKQGGRIEASGLNQSNEVESKQRG